MKAFKYIMAAAAMAMTLSACQDENSAISGYGTVSVRPTISAEVTTHGLSRAQSDEELGQSLIVWLSNSQGVIRQYEGIGNIPESLPLLSGSYLAEAWAGDSVPASWDKRWFKGEARFDITPNANTPVNLVCKIANVVVSVDYAADVDDVLKDYTLTVSHSRGMLEYDSEHTRGYFMMPSTDTDLSFTLTGTKVTDGAIYQRTGTIRNVQPAHEYALKISCASQSEEIGGAFLNIVIDDTEIAVTDESVNLYVAPLITGYRFDIDEQQRVEPGKIEAHTIYVAAQGKLEYALISCQQFEQVFGEAGAVDFDVMAIIDNAEIMATLKGAGIEVSCDYNAAADNTLLRLWLGEDFLNTYFVEDGEVYRVSIDVADSNGHSAQKVARFAVYGSLPPVDAMAPDTRDIAFSHNSATLSARIANAKAIGDITAADFCYAQGAGMSRNEWTRVAAAIDGDMLSAHVDGLAPGTDYSYYVEIAGTLLDEPYKSNVVTFTTEPALQLENSGFEFWTSGSPMLLYGAGQQMYWDSGNHGSATMNKNVTTSDSSVKHSGQYSAKLASQFVGMFGIGRFAAGNAFVGKYLATDGMDGVLGFGRPFTGRPAKLHGWVKYRPVAIDYLEDGYPEDVKKGDMDRGIVYIALLDGTTNEEYPEYPVVVKTGSKQFFDKNGSNVIAYGELLIDATEGDDMVEFEVPLTYNRTDIRPSFVLCTMSASRGGDYFSGGNGSTMWVDDLELIY